MQIALVYQHQRVAMTELWAFRFLMQKVLSFRSSQAGVRERIQLQLYWIEKLLSHGIFVEITPLPMPKNVYFFHCVL